MGSRSALLTPEPVRLEQSQLDRIVLKHEQYLARRPDGKQAELSFHDLSDRNLARRDLSHADLSEARLVRAHLHDCRLRMALLVGPDRSMARANRGNLSSADLRGVSFGGAQLNGALVSEANLSEIVLSAPGDTGRAVAGTGR